MGEKVHPDVIFCTGYVEKMQVFRYLKINMKAYMKSA